ncbi:CTP synthase C-terminal region-related (seleno)protein [Actinokineospora sp.]|uniref:CTP synthase C-terminal region-related (seleno)protein n=1 Tax=Actinokineospora sp. TaxID=1872133 RepID=UPI004037EF76
MTVRIVVLGDRERQAKAHPRIDAISPVLPAKVEWLPTAELRSLDQLDDVSGIWVAPGSPYANRDGVLAAIGHARRGGIPFLGTCGGFQHALVEYARHVVGMGDAEDVQYVPDATTPLITPLECSLLGEKSWLRLVEGSRIAAVFGGASRVAETYHCRYGLNPEFLSAISTGPLAVTAWDDEGAPRAVELTGHPFFVGTLFQPELSSTPDAVHPLIHAFVDAATRHRVRVGVG